VQDGRIEHRTYWDLDFPDKGQEKRFADDEVAARELEAILRQAIRRRFVSERPVCCYISGGLDSTTLLGLASQERGEPVASFTISLNKAGPYDEKSQSAQAAGMLNSPLTLVSMTSRDIADTYPELVRAAEAPVLDTSAACMIRLAQTVKKTGYVVSLSGEGADESLAGYIWFKLDRLARLGGRPIYDTARRFLLGGLAGGGSAHRPAWAASGGVRTGQQFPYEMMAQSREHLFSQDMWGMVGSRSAYDDIDIPERFNRWHSLNQSLYLANKVMLPGMLLAAKGDRTMHNASTEGRFPFLDEDMVAFCASIDPRLKLRGITDKYLLRKVAKNVLPPAIANRPKTMFRAYMATTFVGDNRPHWVDQLLSPVSLKATGYFDPKGVEFARNVLTRKPKLSFQKFVLDMGMAGVISTQLWHHMYCGGGLADLPTWSAPKVESDASVEAMAVS
jgi:asparagine synthase (glutamine-hydrolysing)